MDSAQCTLVITTPHTSISIGFAVGRAIIILLACINVGIVCKHHRRLRQRATPNRILHNSTQSQYPPGSLQSVHGQTNLLNRQGVTVAPSFPQPSYLSLPIHSAHMRSMILQTRPHTVYPPFPQIQLAYKPLGFLPPLLLRCFRESLLIHLLFKHRPLVSLKQHTLLHIPHPSGVHRLQMI